MTWQEDEPRRVYAKRIDDCKAHLATLTPGTEEHQHFTHFLAELEAAGHHLPKE